MGSGRTSWLKYRVILYAVVIVAIFAYRGRFDWSRLTTPLREAKPGKAALVISGSDLAPGLIGLLVDHYRQDFPRLSIETRAGGTNQALEDLLNLRADVALLTRAPSAFEQDLFRQVDGDTAIVVRIGVGGVVVLAGRDLALGDPPMLTVDQLGGLLAGKTRGLAERFYATDPNRGDWAATTQLLDQKPGPIDTTTVTYLVDDRAVSQAVANDPGSLGMIVSYDLPATVGPTYWATPDSSGSRPRVVSLSEGSEDAAFTPSYENVASGAYPAYVPLLVACRSNGGIEGSKFVTHLASARGQRQIERAGCVPAQQFSREIILTTDPPTQE